MSDATKIPVWYWIVAVLATLWNAMGAWDYTATQLQLEFYMASFTEEQLAYFYGFPAWYEAVWAIAVWSALIGSIMLLIRMKLAVMMFLIGLVSFVIAAIYSYGFTNGHELMGMFGLIFSIIIFVVSVALLWMARWAAGAGILR